MKINARQDLREPVLSALKAHGGRASLHQVAKYIWDNYQEEIVRSDLVYTWQYDYRWVAMDLRKAGVLRPANVSPKGVWELT